jgi:intein-encoded DNA endonuclease-like protein
MWKRQCWYRIQVNLNPSPTLCYVLGCLLGDGHVGKCRGWTKHDRKIYVFERTRIRLKICDYPLAQSFYNALKELELNPHICIYRSKNPKWRDAYEVYAYSDMFYEWYTKLTMDEIGRIVESSRECIISFIRGLYETEGSYTSAYLRVLSNTNKELVLLAQSILKKLGFETTVVEDNSNKKRNPKWKAVYHLNLRGGERAIKRFIKTINPVIKREPRHRKRSQN